MSYCVIQTRKEIKDMVKNMFEYVQTNCIRCSFCFNCKLLINLKKELVRTGFDSFNSDITYWSVDWIIENFEYKASLKHYNL